jgi:hypothetical protein
VVQLRLSNELLIDTSGIVLLEVVSGLNTATNGAVLVDLSLHLVSTLDGIVVRNVVFLEVDSSAVIRDAFCVITFLANWRNAISADIDVLAVVLLQVGSLVLLARRVRDALRGGIFIDLDGISTIARSTSLAVDDCLGRQSERSGQILRELDVESIGESGSSSLSPA